MNQAQDLKEVYVKVLFEKYKNGLLTLVSRALCGIAFSRVANGRKKD